jgi:hypothetical protein
MWECQKCHEQHEDSFEVCWNCGTSKAGVEDPTFQVADQVDPAILEQAASKQVNVTGITAASPAATAILMEENGYEFSLEQNDVIRSLASNMQIVGIAPMISGGIHALSDAIRNAIVPPA